MVRKVRNDHIPPHRVWNYVQAQDEFADEEHDHIIQCDHYLNLLFLSLKCSSFGGVLKQLRDNNIDNLLIA
jgi:hypothetical protein